MRAGRRARSCAGLRKSDEGCAEQNGSDDQEIWHESPTSGVDVRGNPDPTCSVPLGRRRGCAARAAARFAADSALEGSEFELPVPRSMQGRSNAIIAASAACHRRPIVCGCRRRTSAKAGQSEISEPKPYRVRNRKFESISLQQTVCRSPAVVFERSRTPAFRAGVRGWLGDRVGRDAQGISISRNRQQYLCWAIFQYRSAADGVGKNAMPVPTEVGPSRGLTCGRSLNSERAQ